ncbi:hypothetical protein QFC21_005947 [Naganishia friedmannii]|uniref:Uncharacterized protein n=1 Tax=Naganishia friedmannii TaxID=89922 RepID=A0ACC2V5N1_9TREE|nr:hypothetical protein QFC21_005947 [Naganishia friedmannii]
MESHKLEAKETSNRSKRGIVEPSKGDKSECELPSMDTSPYSRKRARISTEKDGGPFRPVLGSASPEFPAVKHSTQMLFGSSPLTEPEDDFKDVPEVPDSGEYVAELVPSSQPAEREDVVLDTQEKVVVSQRTEGDSLRPREEAVPAAGSTTEASVMESRISSLAEDFGSESGPVVGPVVAVKDFALPEASANGASEALMMSRIEGKTEDIETINIEMIQTIGEPGNEPGNELAKVDSIDQTKMNVDVPDDEFDDEFDNDLWFDAACLKSFDALETPAGLVLKEVDQQSEEMTAAPRASSMFQTAAGSDLPQVSEAAKATVRSLLSQADQPDKGTSTANDEEEHHADKNAIESFIDTRRPEQLKENEIPAVVGFSTARGKKVDMFSTDVAAKNVRVAKLMQELMDIKNEAVVVESIHDTPKKTSLFTALNGSPMAPISAFAESAVSSIFTDSEAPSDLADRKLCVSNNSPNQKQAPANAVFSRPETGPPATPLMARRTTDTTNGSEPRPLANQESMDYPLLPSNASVLALGMPSINFETPVKAATRHASPEPSLIACDTPAVSAIRAGSLQDISNLQPFTPSQQNGSKRFKSPFPSDMIRRASHMKPLQTPLLSRNVNSASPGPSARKGMSPALPRRVGLGMTPRTRSSLVDRPKFVSPFKGANVDDQRGDIGSPIAKPRSTMRTIFSAPLPKKVIPDTRSERHCFDLIRSTKRLTMVEAGLQPGRFSAAMMVQSGIPPEVNAITPTTAAFYTFLDEGIMKGPPETLKEFEKEGLTYVELEWLENHWRMIVWKLASIVRAKPDMLCEKWKYREVKRQLQYRYEREVNRAQRSAVKRIQEQDSPPSLPMILCVSGIVNQCPALASEGLAVPESYLELTDGWYTIRANVDPPLSRALKTGKLRVGSKIGVSGAKLDASREGTEVLRAYNKSSLCITGNTTSLVAWHRRMGFTHQPFIATLRSLSPDGGNIPLLDVKVTKVFPMAYISTEKGKGASPWSTEEEFRLQDQWKERYMQEQSRLQAEHTQRMAAFEEDVERLRSSIEGVEGTADAYPCEDEDLERYRAASNKAQYIKALPARALVPLYMRAQEEYQSESSSIQAEMEEQIRQRCPPRSTRSFQIIRIVDAGQLQQVQLREAQLQVWDVKQLGDNMFQEGAGYQVSNLVPAQQKAWNSFKEKGEIYLSTTKATAWKRLDE